MKFLTNFKVENFIMLFYTDHSIVFIASCHHAHYRLTQMCDLNSLGLHATSNGCHVKCQI